MSKGRRSLAAEARVQYERLARKKKDPRYARVIGRLVHANLLSHRTIEASNESISIIWAYCT